MYFENFPKFNYDFFTESGMSTFQVQDIFRRVKLTQETLDDSTNFAQYILKDGDTAEQVAFDLYDDSKLWWIVFLSNDIMDVNSEWSRGSNELNRLFDEYLDGKSYYIMETLDIEEKDVMVKRDVTSNGSIDLNTWGIVDDYDKFYHKIDVKTNGAKGTFVDGDEFYIYRNTSNGYIKIDGFGATACAIQGVGVTGCTEILGPTFNGIWGKMCATQGSTFGIIRRDESIKSSLAFFESNHNQINPYSAIDGNSPGGVTGNFYNGEGNLCGLTATLLYKWITKMDASEGDLDDWPTSAATSVKAISRGANIIRDNDDKRMINLLIPPVVTKVIGEFHNLISKSVPPGTTKYITID